MRLWRLASGRYPALDGEGARRWGGRWNSPGRPVVYTSATAALAVLEKLVWTDPEDVPGDLKLEELELPDDLAPEAVAADRLPPDWTAPGCPACVALGDGWLAAGSSFALAVPSAVLPEEQNVLLDPRHPEAARMRVVAARLLTFDLRLLR